MASRQELEILLRAKADTDKAFGDAIKNIRSLESEVGESTKRASGFMKGFGDAVNSSLGSWAKAGVGIAAGAKAFEIVADAAMSAVGSISALAGKAEGWTNVAAATGLGVVQVQKLQAFMEDAGFEAGDLQLAMQKLQTEISSGGENLKRFGISVEERKALAPEQQLQEMARAVMAISDPTDRAAAAIAAFGKSGALHLAAIAGIAQGAYEELNALTEAQVKNLTEVDAALDKAGRTWDDWKKRISYAALQAGQAILDFRGLAAGSLIGEKIVEEAKGLAKGFEELAHISDPNTYLDKAGLDDVLMIARERGKVWKREHAEEIAEAKRAAEEQAKIEKLLYDSKLRAMADWKKKIDEDARFQMDIAGKRAAYELQLLKEETDAAADRSRRRIEYERAFAEIALEYARRIHEADIQATEDFGAFGRAVQGLGDAFGSGFLSNLGSAIDLFSQISVQAQKAQTSMQKATVLVQAAGAAFSSGSILGGAAAGMAAGSMFGPIGAGIGAVAGGLLGLFGKAKKAREEMKKLTDQFAQSMGGMDALKKKAAEAGVALDAMFQAKSKDALLAAIDQIKAKLDLWDEAHQQLQAAIEKYGFTIDELGPKFRQQALDEQAAQLLEDYQLLIASGIDMNLVLEKMGPNFQEYVNTVIKAGGTIPEALRPVIDQMIANGELVDENGVAYKSAEEAGIHFAESMSDQFKTLIDHIEDLVAALTGIPNVHRTVTIDTDDRSGGNRGRGPNDRGENAAHGAVILPFRRMAQSGIVHARPGGETIVAGEGGQDELVAPVAAIADRIGRAAAAAAGAGGVVHAHLHVDGRELAQTVIRLNRAGALPIDESSVGRR